MSLTFGPGPFSLQRQGVLSVDVPVTTVYAEPYARRTRALRNGRVIVDSERGWMVHAPGQLPALWFPVPDIDATALLGGELRLHPGGDDAVDVALAEFGTFDPNIADRWFVEDEPVYGHLRDPYHRVDVVSSHRHVVVKHGPTVVADSTRPKMLFETGLPPRFYLPWADVRLDLLEISATVSECPYKGDGQHWHLRLGEGRLDDAAWSLPHPLPEGIAAAEHVSFYADKVAVTVDDVRLG